MPICLGFCCFCNCSCVFVSLVLADLSVSDWGLSLMQACVSVLLRGHSIDEEFLYGDHWHIPSSKVQTNSRRIMSPAIPWFLSPVGTGWVPRGPGISAEVEFLPELTGVMELQWDKLSYQQNFCTVAQNQLLVQAKNGRIISQTVSQFFSTECSVRVHLKRSRTNLYSQDCQQSWETLSLTAVFGYGELWHRIRSHINYCDYCVKRKFYFWSKLCGDQ